MLPTIVHKYGGSSLADHEALRALAHRLVVRQQAGCRLVVVVSAMGSTTNALLGQAQAIDAHPPQRELDMLVTSGERICMALLSMAVAAAGGQAVSLTGSQSGIITEDAHQGARVIEIRPARILQVLDAGHIAIVAGYQGVSRSREITTLGRGGSDTTAVALGAALGARAVEIYSDVDGVYDADPRVCPQARHLPQVGYTLMADLAHFGARVLHDQAIAFAQRAGIEVVALATKQPEGRATRLGPHVPLSPERFAVAGLDGALWVQEPAGALTVWRLSALLQAQGLEVVAQGGPQALCRWTRATADDGVQRAIQLLGPEVTCRAVDAATLVGDGPVGAQAAAAQAALIAADVPVLAVFASARTLTVAVPRPLGPVAVRVLHGLVPA